MAFIAGAGITNIDLLYTGMPRIPDIGEEIYADGFELQLGGGIPATLIHLSRLGIPTKIATLLGNDLFSHFAKEQYAESGVVPVNLYTGSGIPVNITSAIILPNDRSFITYGKGKIDTDGAAQEQFYRLAHGADIVLIQAGGFTDVYRQLKKEGSLLVLDTGWDDALSLETYGDLLELADYYTPNRKEALKITGAATVEKAMEILGNYIEKPIIKLDKDGCIGMENGKTVFVNSIKEYPHVDSTGAGDAFLAGFCYGLYHAYPLSDCLLLGNIVGGNCVTRTGALSAVITEEALLKTARRYR